MSERISRTCEVLDPRLGACGQPTERAYAAMGGGWMALCAAHAEKHMDITLPVDVIRERGRGYYDRVMRERHEAWLRANGKEPQPPRPNFRDRRVALGLSYEDVAAATGYAPSTIRQSESRYVSRDVERRVANFLAQREAERRP